MLVKSIKGGPKLFTACDADQGSSVLCCIADSGSKLCSWEEGYLLRLLLWSDGAAHSLGRHECLFGALLICGNYDSALDPLGALCAMPCGKDRGLLSRRLYDVFEKVPVRKFPL